MPNIQAISREHHAGTRWQRYSGYRFAAQDAVAPLAAQEFPRAAMMLPIAFMPSEGGFIPVAVQGLKAGQNLFVAADGRWLGAYVPAAYRSYPFRLATTEEGTQVLCIHEDSGLVTEGPEGEPFFNEDGTPSKPVADVLDFLNKVQANREVTVRICGLLQRHGLIQPWPIRLQGPEGEQNIEGLHRIDEAAFNALPAEAFMELREAGALPIVYCHLLSMQHLQLLVKLAEAHAKVGQPLPTTPSGDLNLDFLNQSGTITFGNL